MENWVVDVGAGDGPLGVQVERGMGPVSSAIVVAAVLGYFYRVFRIIRSRRPHGAA